MSYFLGMGVCKLFADRLLRTTWLLHLDVFQHQLDPVLLGGRSRPDLVGLDDVGAWHAFECKGRSSVPNAEERKKAKLQAERLVRVDLTDCSLHVGAISYFRQDRLEFHWRDPEPEEAEKLDPLEVNLPDDAWRHYYAPALALDNGGGKVAMSDARASADVDVEIHPEIREWLVMGEWGCGAGAGAGNRRFDAGNGFPGGWAQGDGGRVVAEGARGAEGRRVTASGWCAVCVRCRAAAARRRRLGPRRRETPPKGAIGPVLRSRNLADGRAQVDIGRWAPTIGIRSDEET